MKRFVVLFCTGALTLWIACASPNDDTETGESPPSDSESCEGTSFILEGADSQTAIIGSAGLSYQALGARDEEKNGNKTAIFIEIMDDREGGEVTPGLYDLDGSTLENCRVCVLACEVQDSSCRSYYMAQEGTVEITARGAEVGESFQATLKNVTYEEVQIDDNSTPQAEFIADGMTWCADGFKANTTINIRPAQMGEPVRDFKLQNCVTEEFDSIHDIARDLKALWLINVTGWCDNCSRYISDVSDYYGDVPESDLKKIIILGEDNEYQEPTLEYCRWYASRFGEDGRRYYIDHDGEQSFSTTFQYISVYANSEGKFELPWNALLSGEAGNFVYEFGNDPASNSVNQLETTLYQLLNK